MSPTSAPAAHPAPPPALHWQLFCRVIDNFGDIGVAWRLATQLGERGQDVTLWADDASALQWMAPQGHPRVHVAAWPAQCPDALDVLWPAQASVVVELFGCELPDWAASHIAQHPAIVSWINLEYLSAEAYVARSHGLASPVMSGPAAGLRKWFYYPGFTPDTGGLLREADLSARQDGFDRLAWRQRHDASTVSGKPADAGADAPWISLFCYEPPGLPGLLSAIANTPTRLLITPGRANAAVQHAWADHPWPTQWQRLPSVPQGDFDHMLWASDFNCVRGEDSLVRALWAGQPFVWHIYPQDDEAHRDKLLAFLDDLDAPDDWRQLHLWWNGLAQGQWLDLTPARLQRWRRVVQAARSRLLAQPDLCSQLLSFVSDHPV